MSHEPRAVCLVAEGVLAAVRDVQEPVLIFVLVVDNAHSGTVGITLLVHYTM